MAKANQVHASCQTTSATIQQPVKINEVETLFCYYFARSNETEVILFSGFID